ncbi:sodium-dependent nutrient amino acid transporter 1 isoform X1 [Drosophila mauritiana]|uniref:Transporter n=1 Tax=Drosophila mauritiana TaxID=7226 RepID=A0A6P8KUV0_DROMA|nr:sodium-dependent nutrient amino acid transporter 1 isoform X1 [Drosophila mauritiana]XP_033172887.1 sodium-dependent nutrient amino acid transporter 1 isoform X1 [Drosophila mauritiana]XP_033172888.1 sodium-dependent nutrient amino acid transporter 1 isoform X1 [Drosophila mauritiana]
MDTTQRNHQNLAFVGDDGRSTASTVEISTNSPALRDNSDDQEAAKVPEERATWGKGVEFLMSCIAMSVGLGNVWRFPFTALDNGGGAFLIPYLIVLFLIGKPIYYLEMVIGQFSSRGSVKVFDLCPAMKGVGAGQAFQVFMLSTYYAALVAIIGRYFIESFRNPLPWSTCRAEWGIHCINSAPDASNWSRVESDDQRPQNNTMKSQNDRVITSSEWYFVKEVLHEKPNIEEGIGLPNWELVIGLFIAWSCVFFIIRRGVKSSGKASYFLALFPYVIMGVLLVRAVTLPGSIDGIYYFIKPQWGKILDPKVWYAAVTQCFYSLSVCFGNIIMYSSFNKFGHNVHRDATIVTGLDTMTSLLAGFTIFGILGHLAHEIGTDDIGSVVKGGAGLAFISYPDAIAKFKNLPQIFSVLFFLMLFVLGIGSNIAMTSCSVTAIRDRFPNFGQWQCSLLIAVVSFFIGLMYITPGGQYMLTLVDFFGASMIALVLGIAELYTIGWIYGTDRLCKDIEFMLGRKVGLYWRLCWSIITPLIMTVILIYFYATYQPLTYNNIVYPNWAYSIGWLITAFGILQLPIWMIVAIVRDPGQTLGAKIRGAFTPKKNWGPSDPLLREQYHKEIENELTPKRGQGIWAAIKQNIFG